MLIHIYPIFTEYFGAVVNNPFFVFESYRVRILVWSWVILNKVCCGTHGASRQTCAFVSIYCVPLWLENIFIFQITFNIL